MGRKRGRKIENFDFSKIDSITFFEARGIESRLKMKSGARNSDDSIESIFNFGSKSSLAMVYQGSRSKGSRVLELVPVVEKLTKKSKFSIFQKSIQ